MKRIICIVATIITACALMVIPAYATDTETVTVTIEASETQTVGKTTTEAVAESVTETADVSEEVSETLAIDGEVASDIINMIENSENKSDLILALVEKYGCTIEEAEEILNSFIALGDKYLAGNEAWIGFKKDIRENTQFWASIIACVIAILAIIGGIFVLLGKTNPTVRKAMFGMTEALDIGRKQYEANSDALCEIKSIAAASAEKEALHEKIIEQKNEEIRKLAEELKSLKESNKKERRNMLMAEAYNMRILKLICDRAAMPVSDKATIDMWYAKGIDSIKDELNASDIQKIDSMSAMLDSIGEGNDGEG